MSEKGFYPRIYQGKYILVVLSIYVYFVYLNLRNMAYFGKGKIKSKVF